eukprot:2211877-Prymnesium_polylepis.1
MQAPEWVFVVREERRQEALCVVGALVDRLGRVHQRRVGGEHDGGVPRRAREERLDAHSWVHEEGVDVDGEHRLEAACEEQEVYQRVLEPCRAARALRRWRVPPQLRAVEVSHVLQDHAEVAAQRSIPSVVVNGSRNIGFWGNIRMAFERNSDSRNRDAGRKRSRCVYHQRLLGPGDAAAAEEPCNLNLARWNPGHVLKRIIACD